MHCSVRILFVTAVTLCAVVNTAEITIETGSALARMSGAERQEALTQAWQATPVVLPDGKQTLGDLVAACTDAGFALRLDDSVDATQSLEFPGFRGSAWDAVLHLAAWFDLDVRPGAEQTGEQWWSGGPEGHSVPWQSGAVVLGTAQGAPLPRSVSGGLFVEIADATLRRLGADERGTLDLAVRLRLEPRSDALAVTDARVAWTSVTVDGRVVDATPTPNEADQVGRLRLTDIPGASPFVILRGVARIAVHEPFVLDLALSPGDSALVPLGDQQARISLLDREQAQAAGKRAACVVVSYPGQVLQGPFDVTVHDGDQPIAAQGTAARHDFNTDSEQVQYLAGLGATQHRITIRGLRRLGMVSQELECQLDLGAFAGHSPVVTVPGAASTVSWAGGDTSLADAVAALRRSGNEVLLDLGVDTTATATLAPYNGTFWEATVLIVQRFGLDILPPAVQPTVSAPSRRRTSTTTASTLSEVSFAGGPARLGRRGDGSTPPQVRLTSCGPVLVEVVRTHAVSTRTLTGATREHVVELRLRLEPRLAHEEVTDGTVWWASTAGGATVRPGIPAGMTALEAPLVAVTVTDLGTAAGPLQLAGMVGFRLQERLRTSTTLRVGDTGTVLLADTPVTVALGPVRDGDQLGLSLRYQRDRLERLEPVVTDSEGRTQESRGRSSRSSNRMVDEQWTLPGLRAEQDYTIVISTQRLRAEPSLPIVVNLNGHPDLPAAAGGEHPPSP